MNLRYFPLYMLKFLIITIIIEIIFAFILGLRKKELLNVVLVNILTNPLVVSITVYVNITYGLYYRKITLIILEVLTIIIEAFIYKKYIKNKNSIRLAILLNLASFFVGELINYL
ncbi:MAG: hypothetical protein IJ574_05855 [Bacilli bacterium]|nr:hypothetical protein [Bacilli bacterium]